MFGTHNNIKVEIKIAFVLNLFSTNRSIGRGSISLGTVDGVIASHLWFFLVSMDMWCVNRRLKILPACFCHIFCSVLELFWAKIGNFDSNLRLFLAITRQQR
jgi:hypothetical protein